MTGLESTPNCNKREHEQGPVAHTSIAQPTPTQPTHCATTHRATCFWN